MPGVVLVAGGSGHLGTRVVKGLADRDLSVRVLTRDPARAEHLKHDRLELVQGDVRSRTDADRALQGVDTVISAIQGMDTSGGGSPRDTDAEGNANLMAAAKAAGVKHFILISVVGAAPDNPMELFRMKYRAEQELQSSGLTWTIARAAAFMEFWTGLVAAPLLATGKAQVFGRGRNPINFVSMQDVADFVVKAVTDRSSDNQVVELAGPENLTITDLIDTFERVTGATGTRSHVPLPVLRIAALVLPPINARMGRLTRAAVVMDTFDMTALPSEHARTRLEEVVKREYGQPAEAATKT